MKIRDLDGLVSMKNNVVALCDITVATLSNFISDDGLMKSLRASEAPSSLGLKVPRATIDLKISNHPLFKNQFATCEEYHLHCTNFFQTLGNDCSEHTC